MDNPFESIQGCTVVRHEDAHFEGGFRYHKLLLIAGIIGVALGAVSVIFAKGMSFGVYVYCIGGVLLGVSCLTKPTPVPERYIVRFPETISTQALLELEKRYEVMQSDEPDLCIVIPRDDVAPM